MNCAEQMAARNKLMVWQRRAAPGWGVLRVANRHNGEQSKDGSGVPRINLTLLKCWEEAGEMQQGCLDLGLN